MVRPSRVIRPWDLMRSFGREVRLHESGGVLDSGESLDSRESRTVMRYVDISGAAEQSWGPREYIEL